MIKISMSKAKEITHTARREARTTEFAPLDQAININIANPTKITEVEAQRQTIRDKYATIQTSIDSCATAEDLKTILQSMKG